MSDKPQTELEALEALARIETVLIDIRHVLVHGFNKSLAAHDRAEEQRSRAATSLERQSEGLRQSRVRRAV